MAICMALGGDDDGGNEDHDDNDDDGAGGNESEPNIKLSLEFAFGR